MPPSARVGAAADNRGRRSLPRGAGREEALAAASREPPDLVLVGLSPGTKDAPELVAELCTRGIPVLVC